MVLEYLHKQSPGCSCRHQAISDGQCNKLPLSRQMNLARLKTLLLFAVLSSLVLMQPGCHSPADSLDEYFADIRIIDSPDSGNVTVYIVLNLSAYPSEPEGLADYTEHLVWQNVFGGESSDAVLHSNAWTNARTSGYWLSGPRKSCQSC